MAARDKWYDFMPCFMHHNGCERCEGCGRHTNPTGPRYRIKSEEGQAARIVTCECLNKSGFTFRVWLQEFVPSGAGLNRESHLIGWRKS